MSLNNPYIYFSISNTCKSSFLSPSPIYFTGIPTLSLIANTIPPLAVPSSFVRTIPVMLVISLNAFA